MAKTEKQRLRRKAKTNQQKGQFSFGGPRPHPPRKGFVNEEIRRHIRTFYDPMTNKSLKEIQRGEETP